VRNFAAVQSRPFNIAHTLQEALSLHQQGRLRDAEKLYARALKTAPDNFDALHLLGLIKAQSGQMGEAYRLMSAALKINPNVPDALINFANVLHGLKRDAEALESLDKALALRPGDLEATLYRGNALSTLNRPQEALLCFDAVLARNPGHPDALLNRGTAFAALGRHAKALADFDAILKHAPNHREALYNRGTALLDLGRESEAFDSLDRTVRDAPQHARAWNNRGRALQALQAQSDDSFAEPQQAPQFETIVKRHFRPPLPQRLEHPRPREATEHEGALEHRHRHPLRRPRCGHLLVYDDLLGRTPSSGELAGYLGVLGSQSRTQMAQLVLGSNEFDSRDNLGFERTEQRLMLRRGFDELAPREREILHLRFFEGLTQREIADEVGISQMHVSRLIRRSLEKIREEIASDELANQERKAASN
jgi:RNA polymerase sigma factor (sigma-70 family)